LAALAEPEQAAATDSVFDEVDETKASYQRARGTACVPPLTACGVASSGALPPNPPPPPPPRPPPPPPCPQATPHTPIPSPTRLSAEPHRLLAAAATAPPQESAHHERFSDSVASGVSVDIASDGAPPHSPAGTTNTAEALLKTPPRSRANPRTDQEARPHQVPRVEHQPAPPAPARNDNALESMQRPPMWWSAPQARRP